MLHPVPVRTGLELSYQKRRLAGYFFYHRGLHSGNMPQLISFLTAASSFPRRLTDLKDGSNYFPRRVVEHSCSVLKGLTKNKTCPRCVDLFNYRFELLKIFLMSVARVLHEFDVSLGWNQSQNVHCHYVNPPLLPCQPHLAWRLLVIWVTSSASMCSSINLLPHRRASLQERPAHLVAWFLGSSWDTNTTNEGPEVFLVVNGIFSSNHILSRLSP